MIVASSPGIGSNAGCVPAHSANVVVAETGFSLHGSPRRRKRIAATISPLLAGVGLLPYPPSRHRDRRTVPHGSPLTGAGTGLPRHDYTSRGPAGKQVLPTDLSRPGSGRRPATAAQHGGPVVGGRRPGRQDGLFVSRNSSALRAYVDGAGRLGSCAGIPSSAARPF